MDALTRRLAAAVLPLAFCSLATAALAEPALWRVSDDDSAVWLFGSVHVVGDENLEWRTPAFNELVANADEVVFEVVLDAKGTASLGRLMIERGFLLNGELLGDLLSEDENKTLDAALTKLGLTRSFISPMRPWLAGVTLASTALGASNGGSLGDGIETQLQAEIPDGREHGLETVEMQIDLLSSGTVEEQVAGLMTAIGELDRTEEQFQSLIAAWLAGDADAIQATMMDAMGSIDDPGYKLLISDRNLRWTEAIAGMLADDRAALIVVGVAHLVGPVGLPVMLADRGFAVGRIDGGR